MCFSHTQINFLWYFYGHHPYLRMPAVRFFVFCPVMIFCRNRTMQCLVLGQLLSFVTKAPLRTCNPQWIRIYQHITATTHRTPVATTYMIRYLKSSLRPLAIITGLLLRGEESDLFNCAVQLLSKCAVEFDTSHFIILVMPGITMMTYKIHPVTTTNANSLPTAICIC